MISKIIRGIGQKGQIITSKSLLYHFSTTTKNQAGDLVFESTDDQLHVGVSKRPKCLQGRGIEPAFSPVNNKIMKKLRNAGSIRNIADVIENSDQSKILQVSPEDLDHIADRLREADINSAKAFTHSIRVQNYINKLFSTILKSNHTELLIALYGLLAAFNSSFHVQTASVIDNYKHRLLFDKLKLYLKGEKAILMDCLKLAKYSTTINDGLFLHCNKQIRSKIKQEDESIYPTQDIIAMLSYANDITIANESNPLVQFVFKHWDITSEDRLDSLISVYLSLLRLDVDRFDLSKIATPIEEKITSMTDVTKAEDLLSILRLLPVVNRVPSAHLADLVVENFVDAMANRPEILSSEKLSCVFELISSARNHSFNASLKKAAKSFFTAHKQLLASQIRSLITRDIITGLRTNQTYAEVQDILSPVVMAHVKTSIGSEGAIDWPMLHYCTKSDFLAIVELLSKNKDALSDRDLGNLRLLITLRNIEDDEHGMSIECEDYCDSKDTMDMIRFTPFSIEKPLPGISKVIEAEDICLNDIFELSYVCQDNFADIVNAPNARRNLLSVFDDNPKAALSSQMIQLFFDEFINLMKGKLNSTLFLRLNKFLLCSPFVEKHLRNNTAVVYRGLSKMVREYQSVMAKHSFYENTTVSRILLKLSLSPQFKRYYANYMHKIIIPLLEYCIAIKNLQWYDLVVELSYKNFPLPDHINAAFINVIANDPEPSLRRVTDTIEHAFMNLQSYVDRGLKAHLDKVYDVYYNQLSEPDISSIKVLLKLLNRQDSEILSMLGSFDITTFLRYSHAPDIIEVVLQRAVLVKETTILDMVIQAVYNNRDVLKISTYNLKRIVGLFIRDVHVLQKNAKLVALIDHYLDINNIEQYFSKPTYTNTMIIRYMLLTEKSVDGFLVSENTPMEMKTNIVKHMLVHNKCSERAISIFTEHYGTIAGWMKEYTQRYLEFVISRIEDPGIQYNAIKAIIDQPSYRKLPYNISNNYLVLWVYLNHNELYEAMIQHKTRRFKRQNAPSSLLAYFREVLCHIGIEHDYYLKEDYLLVAEFIINDSILTLDIGDNSVKLKVLEQIYPDKNVVLFTTDEIINANTADEIEALLFKYRLIQDSLSPSQKESVDELLSRREFDRLQEKENLNETFSPDMYYEEHYAAEDYIARYGEERDGSQGETANK